jgi:hypothetical protein
MEMNLEQFNPTVAELTKLAAESKQLTITDYADPAQVKAVHDQRIVLRDARVGITKKAKEFREDALAFQKKVIEKEKELIALIEPEEYRLQCIEDEAKAYAIKQERERKWPERLERLKELEYKGGSSDDHVLKMLSDVEFETYINNVKAKIEAEALARQRTEQLAREADLKRREDELEAKERKAKMEEAAKENAKREKADAEMREKKRLADLEAARIEGEKKAKADAERIEREKKEAEAKAEKSRKFKNWLGEMGYNENNPGEFLIQHTEKEAIVYKRVGTYAK